MPIQERLVYPVHVCRGTLKTRLPDELEGVTNGTLANIVRQLSSLSRHAEEMFGDLQSNAEGLGNRSAALQARIDRLAVRVTRLDSNVEEISLQDIQNRKAYRCRQMFDQQVVSRDTMPKSMLDRYLACDRPPPLDKLNPYREDGKDGLKFYTDPSYFFDLWRQEMLKDTERVMHDKGRRHHPGKGGGGSKGEGGRQKKRVRQPQSTMERQRQKALGQGEQIMIHSVGGSGVRREENHQAYNPHSETNGHVPQPAAPLATRPGRRLYAEEPIYMPRILKYQNYEQTYETYNYDPGMAGDAAGRSARSPPRSDAQPMFYSSEESTTVVATGEPLLSPTKSGRRPSHPPPQPPTVNNGRESLPPPPPPPPPAAEIESRFVQRTLSGSLDVNGRTIATTSTTAVSTDLTFVRRDEGDELPAPPPPPQTSASSPPRADATSTSLVGQPPPPPPSPPPLPTSNGAKDHPVPKFSSPVGSPANHAPAKHGSPSPGGVPTSSLAKVVRDPQNDVRSDLLKAIRDGITLKKVSEKEEKDNEAGDGALKDVASILARRVAVEMSDSEQSESEYDSDEWGDESAA